MATVGRLNPSRFSDRYYHLTLLAREIRSIIEQYLNGRSNLVLVDYGCGSQPYRPLFEPYLARYIGLDLPHNPAAEMSVPFDQPIPLPNESADVVLSTQVLEHVDDPVHYLRECHRMLKPKQLLILSTHGYWMYHPDPTDLWRWTGSGLRKLLEGSGFRVLRCEGLMGLAATGLHLFQDATIRYLPGFARPPFALVAQLFVALADQLSSRAERANDACVFVIVATK